MEWLNSLTGTAPASTGGAPASADPEESVPDPEESVPASVPASDPTGVLTKHVPSNEQQPTESHTEKRAPRETLHKAAATTRTGRGDAPKPTCPRQRLVLIGLELAILVLAGAGAGVAVALSSSSSSSGTAATMGQELVSIELIASGAVSDYDDAARSDIAARFASASEYFFLSIPTIVSKTKSNPLRENAVHYFTTACKNGLIALRYPET